MDISKTFNSDSTIDERKFSFAIKNKELIKDKIELAIQGDKEAFSYLIKENIDSLYGVAKTILSKEQDIDDAFQNAIIKAYENINKLRNKEFFKTWLTRILINECNKILSKNKRIIHLNDLTNEGIHMDKESDIDLINAVNSLRKKFKIVTWLFYFEDMSIEDISRTLVIPKGTVKSRLARAREELYKIMNNEEEF